MFALTERGSVATKLKFMKPYGEGGREGGMAATGYIAAYHFSSVTLLLTNMTFLTLFLLGFLMDVTLLSCLISY